MYTILSYIKHSDRVGYIHVHLKLEIYNETPYQRYFCKELTMIAFITCAENRLTYASWLPGLIL